jgi:hypothetical protein
MPSNPPENFAQKNSQLIGRAFERNRGHDDGSAALWIPDLSTIADIAEDGLHVVFSLKGWFSSWEVRCAFSPEMRAPNIRRGSTRIFRAFSEQTSTSLPSGGARAMKIGRPRYHQRARWLTIDGPGSSQYYLLDQGGHLVLAGGKVAPHHTIHYRPPHSRPATSERKPFPVPVFTVPSTRPNQYGVRPIDTFPIAFDEIEEITAFGIEGDDPEAVAVFDAYTFAV